MGISVTNEQTGRVFNVVPVKEQGKAAVQFYDATFANKNGFGVLGQFVSEYYVETLMAHEGGLLLDGGIANWFLTATNVQGVKAYLRGRGDV